MNRHCHRIVFNKRRGQLMAVAETAQAGGKTAAGERLGGQEGLASLPGRCRSVAIAVWFAVGALPMAWAQIIADPTAPANQRPTVLSDNVGRPLVNIQTPSAAGLSRNTYKQFDVPTSGIVLNNSAANPWLSNGVLAKTILNEVNSPSQSTINGAITVNGAAAQVIVANPNGITVNGGGFVNASRATLTTGTAQVTSGGLTGFNIRGGAVTIGSGGLNNSATPYTDIMSRTLTLTGALRAQNLGITTGLQTVAYDTGLISNQDTNTYAAGQLTIDTAALGGMYANNISILATEAGLGVRNQGTWQATGGQIVVTADGLVQNLGPVSANVVSLATVKGNIENAGSIQGTQAVVTSSGGDTNLYGAGLKQTAGSAVIISAKGAVNLFSNANYGAAQVSSTATGGQVSISAGQNITLQSGTGVSANKDLQLSSDAMVAASGASITSTSGNVTALAGTGLSLTNSTVTGQQVHLETGAAFKDTAAALSVTGGTVRGATQTTLLSTDSVQVSSPGTSAVSSGGNVHIQAAKAVDITAGSSVLAGQHMSVMAGTTLNLQAASGSTASNGQKVTLTTGGNMLITGNSITATGSNLRAGQDLSMEANDGSINLHALSNAGGSNVDKINLSAGKDLNVSVFKGGLLATGLQATGQNINLVSNGTTSVANATIRNGSNTQAVASTLTAREDLTVGSISTIPGASSQVQVVASSLNAAGQARVLSNGAALITAATVTVNGVNSLAHSGITAGSVSVQAGSIDMNDAQISSNGGMSSGAKSGNINIVATATHASLNASELNSTGDIGLHANGNLILGYGTKATSNRSISNTSATSSIASYANQFNAKDMLSFSSKGAQSYVYSTHKGGAVSLFSQDGNINAGYTSFYAVGTSAAHLSSVSGQLSIEAGQRLQLASASSYNATTDLSLIQGQGDITLNGNSSGTFTLRNLSYGRNLTLGTRNGNMTLNGSAGTNAYGSSQSVSITARGSLTLFANNIHLQGSQLQANGGVLSLTATTGNLTIEANKVTQYRAGFTNTYWDQARLFASSGIDVRSAGDMQLNGISAYAMWGRANFQSGGNLTTSGKVNRWQVDNRPSAGSSYNGWYQDEESVNYTSITSNQGVNLGAMGGHLRVSGTNISGGSGTASLQALGHVRLEAVMTDVVHAATSTGWSRTWWGKKTTWTTYHDRAWRNVNAVSVNARDISIKAGNNIETYATRLNASNNLRIEAGDQALYYAVSNQTDHRDTTYKSSSWIGIRYDKSTEHNTTRISTPMVSQLYASNGNLTSYSGGNQLFQGTQAVYYSRDIRAGVGERARADARIILEGVKTEVYKQRTKESNYVVWQRQVNQGSNTETLTLPSFTGTVNTPFKAPGGISVQIPAGESRSQIATLSQQPGMGYLNELAARTDVNWQPVKLAHDQWDYKQEGLTPAGAALLAAAVAWAMPAGVGTSAVNSLFGVKLTGTSALMANAAFASLAAQASITFVNNKGDIGKTLKELGSSQTVKATIAAALTAGVLDKLGATSTMRDLSAKTGFSDKLTYNLINATGRALTNTAINGGNLEDALKQALIGGLVDTAHGQVASQIKVLEGQYLAHKLAHALAGCVAGAAAGGTCKDGAIGGAVGEVVASMFKPANGMFYSEAEKTNVLAYSKLVAGAVSAFAGGDGQTAITTSEVAVKNNAFFVPPLVYLLAAAAGYTTAAGGGNPVTGLQNIGQGNDPLSKAMASGTQAAVSLSMEGFPKETTAVLNFLNWAGGNIGQAVNATVTYVDDKTGRVVSTQWNSLSPATRDALIGAGKVTSVVVGAAGVQSIKTFVANPKAVDWMPNISLRGQSWEDYLSNNKFNDYVALNDVQANHKTFDFFDPDTGHAVSAKTMDTLGLTRQGGAPMTADNAERYLRNYINDAKSYDKPESQKKAIPTGDIKSKSIELAIPHGTPANVRQALERAATYGRSEGVQVRITVTAK